LITVFEGWAKSEMYLQDLKAGTAPVEVTTGKEFLYMGEILGGKLYILTNEDAPRYRVFVVDAANPSRENWKEIIPQSDAVLQNANIFGRKILAQYEKNVSSQLNLFELSGKRLGSVLNFRLSDRLRVWAAGGIAAKPFSDSIPSLCRLRSTRLISAPGGLLFGTTWMHRELTRLRTKCGRSGIPPKMEPKSRCSLSTRGVWI